MDIKKVLVALLLVAMISMVSTNAEETTQEVNVAIGGTTGIEVTPTSYDYGDLGRGQCSNVSPDGNITLNNTGTADLEITTSTTGIFVNIDYDDGGSWIDANNFSTQVNNTEYKDISTRICIPTDAVRGVYSGDVTFEYIALP